ncbi:AraC family transcriptional regulator [Tateyamaria omphalii]|uniref:helix-turn-helix domain-containing protein n=1 Tax=Tateyamaria omphalii TaxID=299262 RepID=UPI001C99021A|nr:AraC family transcriptional regulator [Tateyamaria omphalii]MBY5935253.1 AraC family transcriptional regulator [Tateyamaria omphalii]
MTPPKHCFRNHLFSFDAGELALHENLMTCVIVGRQSPVRVSNDQDAIDTAALCITPGVPHRVHVREGGADVIYLDGVRLHDHSPDFAALPPEWHALPQAFHSDDSASIDRFRRLLDTTTTPPDPAVMQIVSRLYDEPFARLSQLDLAQDLGLERTQALRHFKATTGQTFRKFKIWAAIVSAARMAHKGEQIGLAGVEAGFADAAHLARTAGTVFGITPTRGLSGLTRMLTLPAPAA